MKASSQANFRLPVDLVKRLRRQARREQRYPANLVSEALMQYLDDGPGSPSASKNKANAPTEIVRSA